MSKIDLFQTHDSEWLLQIPSNFAVNKKIGGAWSEIPCTAYRFVPILSGNCLDIFCYCFTDIGLYRGIACRFVRNPENSHTQIPLSSVHFLKLIQYVSRNMGGQARLSWTVPCLGNPLICSCFLDDCLSAFTQLFLEGIITFLFIFNFRCFRISNLMSALIHGNQFCVKNFRIRH